MVMELFCPIGLGVIIPKYDVDIISVALKLYSSEPDLLQIMNLH